jgi:hypothetical protein
VQTCHLGSGADLHCDSFQELADGVAVE